ncbi:hypothetical protein NGF75_07265 [Dietzia kunjamensis]|uniref:hypothetical protein n=1 Tax=Dietzia kunjamensis TaxID=322509 RepID=UPI002DB5C131|nr:hypothetical protein [Dietzia kunjamensis]MEB8325785.1 hypothetical protein [Dietzia kunjamensis]
MSIRQRLRSLGLAAMAAATALSLSSAVTNSDLVAQTEASYTDNEYAKAGVSTKWPLAYTRLVGGSAYSSSTINGYPDNDTYSKSFQYEQGLTGASGTPTYYRRGPEHTWDTTLTTWPLDTNKALNNNYGNVATNRFASPYGVDLQGPGAIRCQFISATFADTVSPPPNQCGTSANTFAAASLNTRAFGFGVRVNVGSPQTINAVDIKTAARCSLTTLSNEKLAEASIPSGRIDIGVESISATDRLAYTEDYYPAWNGGAGPFSFSGFQRIRWLANEPTYVRYLPVITVLESQNPPRAFSEVALYMESWTSKLDWGQYIPNSLAAKMYFVLSRSECGVKRTSDINLPEKSAVFPINGMPGGNARTKYEPSTSAYVPNYWSSGFTVNSVPAEPLGRRAASESIVDSELPPTTTLTSPLENSTASETTTSAPPDPSGGDESPTSGTSTAATTSTTRRTTTVTSAVPTVSTAPTSTTTPPATKTVTTTSAAPAVAIPDDPGTLSPTARFEDVGTVTMGGEDFVVVVQGTTVPTDAQQGMAALEIWLNGGDPGDTWATFTSTDPDADGWRWAAINQETGTVIYIR